MTGSKSNSKLVKDASSPTDLVRVSKIMADRGLCSRREADALIEKQLVKVDGELAVLGQRVSREADIEILRIGQTQLQKKVTILLNKPVGFVSGQPEPGYEPAVRLITASNQWISEVRPDAKPLRLKREHFDGLAPAGRLDIDSRGLLVFTQDGVIARSLVGDPKRDDFEKIEKEYLVWTTGALKENGLRLLCHGLELDGKKLERAEVSWIEEGLMRFVLREGRKRQIRRMCELVGLKVTGLKRIRIGRVELGRLPEGQWRFLNSGESF